LPNEAPGDWVFDELQVHDGMLYAFFNQAHDPTRMRRAKCPYGVVGDRLWVRETWATIPDEDDCSIAEITAMNECGPASLFYAADPPNHGAGKWRPSIHMPRWASRLTLEIIEVRVQRLQEISEADIIQEGCPRAILYGTGWYRDLWNDLNAKRGFPWSANPWVWALTFKRVP
jgi:hypothetical protein